MINSIPHINAYSLSVPFYSFNHGSDEQLEKPVFFNSIAILQGKEIISSTVIRGGHCHNDKVVDLSHCPSELQVESLEHFSDTTDTTLELTEYVDNGVIKILLKT